jgi:hypothetical protein
MDDVDGVDETAVAVDDEDIHGNRVAANRHCRVTDSMMDATLLTVLLDCLLYKHAPI